MGIYSLLLTEYFSLLGEYLQTIFTQNDTHTLQIPMAGIHDEKIGIKDKVMACSEENEKESALQEEMHPLTSLFEKEPLFKPVPDKLNIEQAAAHTKWAYAKANYDNFIQTIADLKDAKCHLINLKEEKRKEKITDQWRLFSPMSLLDENIHQAEKKITALSIKIMSCLPKGKNISDFGGELFNLEKEAEDIYEKSLYKQAHSSTSFEPPNQNRHSISESFYMRPREHLHLPPSNPFFFTAPNNDVVMAAAAVTIGLAVAYYRFSD